MSTDKLVEWAQQAQKDGTSITEIRRLMNVYELPADKQNTIISTIVPRNSFDGTVVTVGNGSAIIAANDTTYTVPVGNLKAGDIVKINAATETGITPTVTLVETFEDQQKQSISTSIFRATTLEDVTLPNNTKIKLPIDWQDRSPESKTQWLNENNYTATTLRQAGFDESLIQKHIDLGLYRTSGAEIKQIYNELLGRDPDQNNIELYRNLDPQQIKSSIINSTEYKTKSSPITGVSTNIPTDTTTNITGGGTATDTTTNITGGGTGTDTTTNITGGGTATDTTTNITGGGAATDTTTNTTGGGAATDTTTNTTGGGTTTTINNAAAEKAASQSISTSQSISQSESASISRAISNSQRLSTTASLEASSSLSESISLSESTLKREISNSQRLSTTASLEASRSLSASISLSESTLKREISNSQRLSTTASLETSRSLSASISKSISESPSISKSISQALSISVAQSIAAKAYQEAQQSISTKLAISQSISQQQALNQSIPKQEYFQSVSLSSLNKKFEREQREQSISTSISQAKSISTEKRISQSI